MQSNLLMPAAWFVIAAVALPLLAIVAWVIRAVIRHPVKLLATVASILGLLVLLGVAALVAAIVLPHVSRVRHVTAVVRPVNDMRREVQTAVRETQATAHEVRAAMHEAQAAVREVEATVRNLGTSSPPFAEAMPPVSQPARPPAEADNTRDRWLAAAATSIGGPLACREMACVNVMHQVLEALRKEHLLDDKPDAGKPLFLMMELAPGSPQESWNGVAWAINWAAEHDPSGASIRIDWPWRRQPGAPSQPPFGRTAVVVQWQERDSPRHGLRSVMAQVQLPAETVAERRDGQTVNTVVRRHVAFSADHNDKAWVLSDGNSNESADWIIGRSGVRTRSDRALRDAHADARRELERRLPDVRRRLRPEWQAMLPDSQQGAEMLAQLASERAREQYVQSGVRAAGAAGSMAAVRYDVSPASVEAWLRGDRQREQMAPVKHRMFMAAALLGLVVLGYWFLDAGRRGWLKWPLRIGATMGFLALYVVTLRLYRAGMTDSLAALPAAARASRAPAASAERMIELAKTSPDGVAEAVALAASGDFDGVRLKPLDLLVRGEYLLLGGHAERAVASITEAIRRGGSDAYYHKSLGWALRQAGHDAEGQQEFTKAAGDLRSWTARPAGNSSMDAWTAAFFLELVNESEYADCWKTTARDESMACFPWFYIGQKMEIEGDRDRAIAAYRKSVELGKRPGAHYIRNWSAYRLGILTGAIRPPSSTPPVPSRESPASMPAVRVEMRSESGSAEKPLVVECSQEEIRIEAPAPRQRDVGDDPRATLAD